MGFSWLFRFFGVGIARRFNIVLACLFYYIIPVRKQTVLDNLRLVFPEYSDEKIHSIAFNCYKSFATSIIEILCIPSMSEADVASAVLFEGKELILKRYNEKKGVIILSAHFGNWELCALAIGHYTHIPISVIVKPQRNGYVTDWLNKTRGKFGNKVVSVGISIRHVYAELKAKNIIAIVGDQRASRESIRVNFMGRPTSVYEGPAVLSLKTNSPIIIGVPVRQKDNSYRVNFEEVSMENLPENEKDKIIEISQRHMAILERYIRQNPEQWLWMHKRWKY